MENKSVGIACAEMLQLLSNVLCICQQWIFDAAGALSDRSQLMEAWEHGGGRALQWFPQLHRQAPSKFGALGSYGTEGLSFDELPGTFDALAAWRVVTFACFPNSLEGHAALTPLGETAASHTQHHTWATRESPAPLAKGRRR